MPTKEDLILENELLQRKLALAEAWMRREVASQKKSISQNYSKQSGRKKLDNLLERDSVDIITHRIESYFGSNIEKAPKFTLEHLIDAEIYWQTLQKFPTLDALPVVSSYQKVIDAYFGRIIDDFYARHHVRAKRIRTTLATNMNTLDTDIENVLKKKYSLSLGRWYLFFQRLRDGNNFGGVYEDMFLTYLSENQETLIHTCTTDPFYRLFEEIIKLEVFGKKRHDAKISYADAKKVRENMLYGITPILPILLFLGNSTKEIINLY